MIQLCMRDVRSMAYYVEYSSAVTRGAKDDSSMAIQNKGGDDSEGMYR